MENRITFYFRELEEIVRIYFHNQNLKMKNCFISSSFSCSRISFLSPAKADYCYGTYQFYGNGNSQRCSNGSSSSYYEDNNDGVYKFYGYSGSSGGHKYPSTGINWMF